MNRRKVFCPECRKEVTFTVKESIETAIVKGEAYKFTSQIAYCDECETELYVAELEDTNLKTLYDVYRKAKDIISSEDIRKIPEKYNIGKRPLSKLLGWGEQTFTRYFDGDIPSKQYSEILKRILENPAYYLSVLEQNKENLDSERTYIKSKTATKMLFSLPVSAEQDKIDLVINYILSQCSDITNMALQKTLYYAQGFCYAFHHSFLFAEDCEAWVHGPVYREVYSRYRNYCFDPIDRVNAFDFSSLTGEEVLLLDNIIRHVCCYSGKTLEYFTHTETPWVSARLGISPEVSSDRIISKQAIGEYFTSVKDKYHMLTPVNIKDYTQNMFSQI